MMDSEQRPPQKTVKQLFQEFTALYAKAHPNLSKSIAWSESVEKWKGLKVGKVLDMALYDKAMLELKSKLVSRKKDMFSFLLKRRPSSTVVTSSSNKEGSMSEAPGPSLELVSDLVSNSDEPDVQSSSELVPSVPEIETDSAPKGRENIEEVENERTYEAPKQVKLSDEIKLMDSRLAKLNEARNMGLGDENSVNLTKQINDLTAKKREKVQKLNKLKIAAKANKKLRDKRKRVLNQAIRDFPSIASSVTVKETVGRPPLEDRYPDLHRDLLEIATIGAACSERRREDLFRSVKTLDDLHNALSGLNYKISRTALYYRLLPKKESSEEGKKHVHTVPVR